jgi:hypothetical protein
MRSPLPHAVRVTRKTSQSRDEVGGVRTTSRDEVVGKWK